MAGSVNGTQTNDFAVHSRSQVSVVMERSIGSIQLLGFSDDDDAIQIRQLNDSSSYSGGLYGNTTANINTDSMGEIVLKIKGTSDDNERMALWHAEMKAGNVDPATIIITGANYKHSAFNCLPRKPAEPAPASSEDPVMEWVLNVASVELFKKIA